jgi:hypothetical protein
MHRICWERGRTDVAQRIDDFAKQSEISENGERPVIDEGDTSRAAFDGVEEEDEDVDVLREADVEIEENG